MFSVAQAQVLSVMVKQNGIGIELLQPGENASHLVVAFEDQLLQLQRICMLSLEVTVVNTVSRNPRRMSFIMEMALKAV